MALDSYFDKRVFNFREKKFDSVQESKFIVKDNEYFDLLAACVKVLCLSMGFH